MVFEIFSNVPRYSVLPESDGRLKELLNYNPALIKYSKNPTQIKLGRTPGETDRGGWRGYDRVYSKYFYPKQAEPLEILEIGIERGYGLLTWARYFGNAHVTGIDLPNHPFTPRNKVEQEKIAKQFTEYDRVTRLFFNTTVPDKWDAVGDKLFDIIIDDGGHNPDTQTATFSSAWSRLKPGGLYFIEDISHRYSDQKLLKLDNLLSKIKRQGHTLEVYSHNNIGLSSMLNNNKKVVKYSGVTSDAPNNSEEYIAVIEKYNG